MNRLLGLAVAGLLFITPAFADFTGKDGSLATITFKNATGACTAVVCVPQNAITDSTGTTYVAVTTAGADAQSNTANGLLIYNRALIFNGTTWDRWQGAVTITSGTVTANIGTIAGISTKANQDTNAATTAHTCSVAGYSELGCLGQIDDDVKGPIAAGTNIIGKVGIDQTTPGTTNGISGVLITSNGWTPVLLNALSTTVKAIKSSAAGQLGLLQCSNSNTATVFIQVFDVATAGGVTLGTTVPVLSFEVPPGTPNGYTLGLLGVQFANGIQVAATTTATGSTAQTGTLPNCNAGFH